MKVLSFILFMLVGAVTLVGGFLLLDKLTTRVVNAVDAATGGLVWPIVGLAVVVGLVILVVGVPVALVRRLHAGSRLIKPTDGGQFPLVKVGGRQWSGYFDPNRSPSSVTLFDDRGGVAHSTPLSEAATVQLSSHATAAAMVAGATRHPSTGRHNVMTAVDAVTRPPTMPPAMPRVEVVDDADHIDRLLQLEGPDDEEVWSDVALTTWSGSS